MEKCSPSSPSKGSRAQPLRLFICKPELQMTEETAPLTEKSLFLNCMVPLKLKSSNKVIWENNKPSYTLYCRLICFRYEKESKERILEEERFLRQADLAHSVSNLKWKEE